MLQTGFTAVSNDTVTVTWVPMSQDHSYVVRYGHQLLQYENYKDFTVESGR